MIQYTFSAGSSALVVPVIDALGVGWTFTLCMVPFFLPLIVHAHSCCRCGCFDYSWIDHGGHRKVGDKYAKMGRKGFQHAYPIDTNEENVDHNAVYGVGRQQFIGCGRDYDELAPFTNHSKTWLSATNSAHQKSYL